MNNEVQTSIREKRKYRKYTPIFYMALELIGIGEIFYMGYSVFGNDLVFILFSALLTITLASISLNKTKAVYQRSYQFSQQVNLALQTSFTRI